MFDKALLRVCTALTAEDRPAALRTIQDEMPFQAQPRTVRGYTDRDLVQTALRDGFVDRYSGRRLVFPGALRLLSTLFPEDLPFHPNWAYDKCHAMYWELYPTLDHVQPASRGGPDESRNWVTTSQRMNSAKAHWTLDELGWTLVPAGDLVEWDGLLGWFLDFTEAHGDLTIDHPALRKWRAAAMTVSKDHK